jgi:hypothetical protein
MRRDEHRQNDSEKIQFESWTAGQMAFGEQLGYDVSMPEVLESLPVPYPYGSHTILET